MRGEQGGKRSAGPAERVLGCWEMEEVLSRSVQMFAVVGSVGTRGSMRERRRGGDRGFELLFRPLPL